MTLTRLFNYVFFGAVSLFVLWKFILPYLFSQKSDVAVVVGCAIVLVIGYYAFRFIIEHFIEGKF